LGYLTGEGGEGRGKEPNHTTARKKALSSIIHKYSLVRHIAIRHNVRSDELKIHEKGKIQVAGRMQAEVYKGARRTGEDRQKDRQIRQKKDNTGRKVYRLTYYGYFYTNTC
jgi:hypothetical protein